MLPILVCLALVYVGYRVLEKRRGTGSDLHRRAFAATFEERDLPVPAQGPREGYWGARLGVKQPIDVLGWHEPEVTVPGLLAIDGRGLQRTAADDGGPADLLVVGGSVAFGACASSEAATYFHVLQQLLGRARVRRIDIFGAGGWTSTQELPALRLYLGEIGAPRTVLVLDGLNDLTNGTRAGGRYDPRAKHSRDFDARVSLYLRDVSAMADAAGAAGARTVVALQPSLFDKPRKSRIEKRLVEATLGSLSLAHGDAAAFSAGYARMREGLREMERAGKLRFVDCSVLDADDARTTFLDVWHFTDPGHRALAHCLLPALQGEGGGEGGGS